MTVNAQQTLKISYNKSQLSRTNSATICATATCCKQRWTLRVINLRRVKLQVDSTCDGRRAVAKMQKNQLSSELEIKFQREVTLCLKVPEFPYNTMYDKPSIAMYRSIHSAVSTEHQLVTDRRTTGHSISRCAMHTLRTRRAVKILVYRVLVNGTIKEK